MRESKREMVKDGGGRRDKGDIGRERGTMRVKDEEARVRKWRKGEAQEDGKGETGRIEWRRSRSVIKGWRKGEVEHRGRYGERKEVAHGKGRHRKNGREKEYIGV